METPGERSEVTWHYGRWVTHEEPVWFWMSRPLGTLAEADEVCREANAAMGHDYRVYRRKTTVEITEWGAAYELLGGLGELNSG